MNLICAYIRNSPLLTGEEESAPILAISFDHVMDFHIAMSKTRSPSAIGPTNNR